MNTLSIEELGIKVPHVQLGRTSLVVLPEAEEQDYARLEQILETVSGSAMFWWGDYLNHLASVRGVDYAEARAASGHLPGTLRTASWVCRHVDPSRRRDALGYSHHLEVAALSPTDQEIWLDRAEGNEWSTKQLRAEIRQSKAQVTNGPEQAPVDQRAARASEGFEVFSAWYEAEAECFTAEQSEEWDDALRPLVSRFVARLSFDELTALYEAAT